jgi:glycine/D-amino acid oxidase-like deaminating enzyme
MRFDVAVIGAGIVGAACAASLSTEGLRVVVIDSGGVATGTTAAGMGHIVVMDDSPAQFALTSYSQELWNRLADELPRACEYERCGTIWVAADDEEMLEVHRKYEYYSSRGISTDILDERALRQAEPNLREGLAGGLLVKSDSVVYQLTASDFLIEKARTHGAVTRFGEKVSMIMEDGVRLNSGETIAAHRMVNAAGINAPALTSGIRIDKRKGHLAITDRYPNFASHQLVELGYLRSAHGSERASVAFNLQPRATGQMLVGSSRQFGADELAIDRKILRRMTERAFEYIPALRDLYAVRIWTGFRPSTPDNLPYIGPSPTQANTFVAAGHEGLGITTALGTAELITDMIVGRGSAIPTEPYSLSRSFTTN